MWESLGARHEGLIVVVEPLGPEHEDGLWQAAEDPKVWRWMSVNAGGSREAFGAWFAETLEKTRAGLEQAFAVLDAHSRTPIGSTRYMTLRPEHRGLEIGWTWLASSTWGSGANVETKYLLLRHAFEGLGCMRVEFKTDASNKRSRAALAALPARFEGVFQKHMLVRDGAVRHSAWYAVTDEDWPAVRQSLEERLKRVR
jgi:RimJ/RimL family protein N-acetyltransferase